MSTQVWLVPHTHWDREWYEPFAVFSERLVTMMDTLLDLGAAGFPHFHLDGQTAMIDDYLARRPERADELATLVRSGQLSAGPWVTQMDEFLTSGESHIRNLEMGLQRAQELGAALWLGYMPDQFGHIGQMPQILRLAGIDRAMVWRGVPASIDTTSFRWRAPDGSEVVAEYMPYGYSNGSSFEQTADPSALDVAINQSVDALRPFAVDDRFVVMVGYDHSGPDASLPERLATDGFRIAGLASYLEGRAEPEELPIWTGELRSSARAHLLPNVYSARVQPSTLYPTGRVTTGQTVFTKLVDRVATGFDYRFVSALPHTVSGTAHLTATLQSSTGWTKQLSSRAQHFSGDQVRLAGTLDMRSLERQVGQYAKLTGIGNDSFTVELAPTVDVQGDVAGTPISQTFAPTALNFALDGFALRLEQSAPATLQPGTTAPDALHPSEPGVVPQHAAASVKLLVAKLRVSTARTVGLAGFGLAAIAALVGFALLGVRRGDELASIQRRNGGLLVPVSSAPAAPAGGYIEVANFDSLAHLARSYQLMILHHQRGEAHSFYLDDDGSIYRYGVRAGERHAQAG